MTADIKEQHLKIYGEEFGKGIVKLILIYKGHIRVRITVIGRYRGLPVAARNSVTSL